MLGCVQHAPFILKSKTIMEIERINALANQLADLAKRAASLRGYL